MAVLSLFSRGRGFCLKAISLTALFIFLSCAVQAPPDGGPIDRTPPEIIYSYPPADSTQIKDLSNIVIRFSERMDENSANGQIFFSPPLEFEHEWDSADELHLNIKDSLKQDQTYVMVLGTALRDLRASNKLAQSFQLAFSTGEKIDQGRVSGSIFGLSGNTPATVVAYALQQNSDTLSITRRADYISQSGEKGIYSINYMKPGRYRVFAFVDANKNQRIDAQSEEVGLPWRDTELDSSILHSSGLEFRLARFDTTAPQFINARPKGNTRVDLRFSESIFLPAINQISVRDSVSGKELDVLAVSPDKENENTVALFTTPLEVENVYGIRVTSVKDSSGNTAAAMGGYFSVRNKTETDSFMVQKISPRDSSWNEHPQMRPAFAFSRPVNDSSFISAFSWMDADSKKVAYTLRRPNAFEFICTAEEKLDLDREYRFTLQGAKLKDVWQNALADTTYLVRFKIHDGTEYGSVSGAIYGPDEKAAQKVKLTLEPLSGRGRSFKMDAINNKPFSIPDVPDGKYRIRAFWDADSNGSYSYGALKPFRFSEAFYFGQDTISVRKRWETTDIRVQHP